MIDKPDSSAMVESMIDVEEIGANVLLVRNLVSQKDCDRLLANAPPFAVARMTANGRNNLETFLVDPALADRIKRALRRHLAVSEVDDLFELYKYCKGQSIDLHTDAARIFRDGQKSTAALLVYLSERFGGGRTLFPELDLGIAPAVTEALIFPHGMLHAAEEVTNGVKLVARVNIAL